MADRDRLEAELVPQADGWLNLRLRPLDPPLPPRSSARRRIRRVAFGMGAVFLLGTLALALKRVSSTVVTAELVTSNLQFRTDRDVQLVLADLPLRRANVSRAGSVQPGGISDWPPQPRVDGERTSYGASIEARPGGAILLTSLSVPPESRVSLRADPDKRLLRVEIRCDSACGEGELALGLGGAVRVQGSGVRRGDLALPVSRPVGFGFGEDGISLDLHLAGAEAVFPAPLYVDSLALDRRDVLGTGAEERERSAPAVRSGTFQFLSYPDRQRRVHRGQDVRMALEQGVVDHLALGREGIQVILTGRFSSLSTGPAGIRRNLVPTWLEHLHQLLGLQLVVVTILAAFPVAFGVARWWLDEGE
ncbi:MAG TPA: hypothetical protein VF006_21545 [Longimicrobium sp.]